VKVVWTQKARLGIGKLHRYIAKDSLINADRFVERIFEATNALAESPRIGKMQPGTDNERIRYRIVQSQRVIYAIDEEHDAIKIVALVHVRQDIASMVKKPWE
jgi:plasmid stabilization system protein ParE